MPRSVELLLRPVSACTFLRTGEFVRVQVDEISERFVTLLQQFAMNGVVVEASEADPPWHKPS